LLRGIFKYVKHSITFRKNKVIFLKRTKLIQNRTVHRQIAQRNDARAKNNSVGQKEDQKIFSKKGVTENYRDLFYGLFFSIHFVFVKCVLSSFYRAEVSQKLLLRDPDPFTYYVLSPFYRSEVT